MNNYKGAGRAKLRSTIWDKEDDRKKKAGGKPEKKI